MTGEVLLLATSRGGPVHAPRRVTGLTAVKDALVGGDAALMAVAAFHAGASVVASVRVNEATPASLHLGDMRLTSQEAGQIGAATIARRDTRTRLRLRNPVLGATETHQGDDLDALMASVNTGTLVTAQPAPDAPRFTPHGQFLDEGDDGPTPTLDTWLAAAAAAENARTVVVGSGDPQVVAAVTNALPNARVYAGPDRIIAKTDLKSAALAIAAAAPTARVVCNTVMLTDTQTNRAQDFPAYVLAAYAAGLWARGHRSGPHPVNLRRLGFVLDDTDELELEAGGVITVRYDHDQETYSLAEL